MGAIVIIQGYDPTNRVDPAAFALAVSSHGATVDGCSPNCIVTTRVSTSDRALGNGPVQYLDHAEFKPAEMYVLSFPNRASAVGWIDISAGPLKGKVVYLIDPPPAAAA